MATRQYTGKITEVLVNTGRFSVFRVSHFSAVIPDPHPQPGFNNPVKPSTAVCTLGAEAPGESWVLLTGNWRKHKSYGWQFAIDRVSPTMPQDAEAIRDYLKSGEIDLIGEELAGRLVDRFGDNTLKVMEKSPARLTVVRGIGELRAETIAEHVKSKRFSQSLAADLVALGVPDTLVPDLHKRYGDHALGRIKRNPYEILAGRPIYRFDVADAVASQLGCQNDQAAIQGLIACSVHALNQKVSRLIIPLADLEDYIQHQYPEYSKSVSHLPDHLPANLTVQKDRDGRLVIAETRTLTLLREVCARLIRPVSDASALKHCLGLARLHQSPGALAAVGEAFGAHQVSIIDGSQGTVKQTFLAQFMSQATSIAPALHASLFCLSRQEQGRLQPHFEAPVSLLGPVLKTKRKSASMIDPLTDIVVLFEAEKLDLAEMVAVFHRVPETATIILVGDRGV